MTSIGERHHFGIDVVRREQVIGRPSLTFGAQAIASTLPNLDVAIESLELWASWATCATS